MARKAGKPVDFNKDLFSQLNAEPEVRAGVQHEFPEWDILKELDRRRRRGDRGKRVRDYMRSHPDEVEKARRKVVQ